MAEVADFLLRFPSFNATSSQTIAVLLADAEGSLEPSAFSNESVYLRAVFLLTAHYLTLQGLGAGFEAKTVNDGIPLGMLTSVSDGGVSMSFKSTDASSETRYSTTSYGRELSLLLKSSGAIHAVVGGGPCPT